MARGAAFSVFGGVSGQGHVRSGIRGDPPEV